MAKKNLRGASDKINPIPAEVEKPMDLSTSSGPLIKTWVMEKMSHAFIFASARSFILAEMRNKKMTKVSAP